MTDAKIIPLVKPNLFGSRSTWAAPAVAPPPVPLAPEPRNIIQDAPSDGRAYGRMNGQWEMVVPLRGETMQGRLFLIPANPTAPLEAVHKRYVDELFARLDAGYY